MRLFSLFSLAPVVLFFWLGHSLVSAASDFEIATPGKEFPVNYSKYGEFKNVGTQDYEYMMSDDMGLSEAVGEGVFPDNFTIYSDPAYQKLVASRRLIGSRWEYASGPDIQACFFKWAIEEAEEPGVKLFYTALNLERAGLFQHAAKAYYACIVHFPRSVGWTYWQTPWYVGVVAMDKLESLLRNHEELEYTLVDASIMVEHGFDIDVSNDVFFINPGKWIRNDTVSRKNDPGPAVKTLGGKHGKVLQFKNGDWQFQMEDKTVLLKTISYQPAPVGQSYDENTMKDWMLYDSDKNGVNDSAFESFVDKNGNHKQDIDEPRVGDFKLMADMGANTLRLYHHGTNKELLHKAYQEYGLHIVMGDLLGMYGVGSGASWDKGTDYSNAEQKMKMMESVKQMLMEYKDEPGVCLWVLGNENNYGGQLGNTGGVGNAAKIPEQYYAFVNEAARWIKSIDPTRPVAICNGEIGFLDIIAKQCPDVDIFGVNAYRGEHGFGPSLWQWTKKILNRPVYITEYGCPAYHQGKTFEFGEKEQVQYHEHCWKDIVFNSYQGNGAGNSIGGVLFEWVDGWWKSGQPPRFSSAVHETIGQWPGPFPDGWSYEEWYGVCGQGDGTQTPFLRTLRPLYTAYQKWWKQEELGGN